MSKIVLKDVRLSFPSLYATELYNGNDTGKYAATFLIEKGSAQEKAILAAAKSEAEAKFGKPLPKGLKSCIKDGDDQDYDGYAGMRAIKANTKKRPVTLNRDKSVVVEDDDVLYAGCYVNASIEIYALDNQYGKRVSCQLNGVQFVRGGDSFGNNNDTMADFEAMDGDADVDGTEEDDNPFG